MRDTPSVLTFEENLLTTAVGVSLFGEVLPPLFFAVGTPLISEGIANIFTYIELPIAIPSVSIGSFFEKSILQSHCPLIQIKR